MIIKPHVPTPCAENWEAMKIELHSRFCENCKKDVVDFTSMSRQEILETLFTNYDKKICGRFKKLQLDFSHTDLLITINALSKDQKNTNLAFYLLTVGTLVLMGCNDNGNGEKRKSTISIDFDSNNDRNKYDLGVKENKKERSIEIYTLGMPVYDINTNCHKPDTIGTKYNDSELAVNGMEATDESQPYTLVDEMPEFYGGITALSDYLKKNLKYPEWERKNKIEGTVYVTFMVNRDGKIKYPRILRGVEKSKNFDQEVIRVIEKMPLWKPGRLRRTKVNVQYHLPIKFIL
jgi:TonB family protein